LRNFIQFSLYISNLILDIKKGFYQVWIEVFSGRLANDVGRNFMCKSGFVDAFRRQRIVDIC